MKTMQVKQDKERIVDLVNSTIAIARTSSYYRNIQYTYIDVNFFTGSLNAVLSTSDVIDAYVPASAEMALSGGAFILRMLPYQM